MNEPHLQDAMQQYVEAACRERLTVGPAFETAKAAADAAARRVLDCADRRLRAASPYVREVALMTAEDGTLTPSSR